jgi:hypothetical protein
MSRYTVRLGPPKGHEVPPLLQRFGKWLARQPYGAVGWFELLVEAAPPEWSPEVATRLGRDGFSFIHLPDGSLLLALRPGRRRHPAVALLGSEGETGTIASSIEEFLLLLAAGETGVDELDDEEADGRGRLQAWLKKNGVKAPRVKPFDFEAYLDDEAPRPPPPAKKKKQQQKKKKRPTRELAERAGVELGPFLQRVVAMVGRRADDEELVAWVTKDLGKKVPGSIGEHGDMKHVTAPRLGLELGFDKDVLHVDYPPVNKTKRSYVPYLSIAWLGKKLPDPLPFGLTLGMSPEAIEAALGPPDDEWRLDRETVYLIWKRPLDEERAVILQIHGRQFTIQLDDARDLELHSPPNDPVTGLFIAWAARRGLLERSCFPEHGALIDAIAAGEERGSALRVAAMPRGLWDAHLLDRPGLRNAAFRYFHNVGKGGWITRDLIKAFGGRKGPHGHDAPRLDADDAEALKKAQKILDERFAVWV